MTLDDLRQKAIYQNSIDTWIAACGEKDADWYSPDEYRKFISFLSENKISMKKFPLCVKEVGGEVERGRDKTKFAETLAESEDPNSAAYTLKLNDATLEIIRSFSGA